MLRSEGIPSVVTAAVASNARAPDPTWDPLPVDLIGPDELRHAAALAAEVGADDLRLGPLARTLAVRGVALRGLVDDPTALRRPAVAKLVAKVLRLGALSVAEDLRDVARHLVATSAASERNIGIFVRRYAGPDDAHGAAALQAIAEAHGLTRERVRQVTEAMLERASARPIASPAFRRLIDLVPAILPRSEADATEALRGLLGPGLSVGAALRYGTEVLRAEPPVALARLERQARERTLVWGTDGESMEWLDAALAVSTAMMRGCGIAHLPRVIHEAEAITGRRIGAAAAVSALATIANLEWIDDQQEWFWFVDESRKNRLVGAVRKMIAIAREPLDIEEIYGGLARMRGDRVRLLGPYPPPPWAVQAVCARLSILKCKQSNRFLPAVSLLPASELSTSELLIYRYMESRAGLGSRRELGRALVEGGESKHLTIHTTIATSPIIKQVDRGVYGLRGWPLSSTMLQRTQAEVGAGEADVYDDERRAAVDAGFLEWIATLTASGLSNDQTNVPMRLRAAIHRGVYRLPDADGELRISTRNPNTLRGVARVAQSRGWGAGSRLRVRINPKTRAAELRLYVEDIAREA